MENRMLNRPAPRSGAPLLQDAEWQMSFGERAALEGLLSQLKPRLSIEIGTAEGGSLARICAHSEEVHSFDLVEPDEKARELPGVELHTGDGHVLLPAFLAQLAQEKRNVDFVLVDGDHSTEGVRRDMEDLLDSPAIGRTVIVAHDTANEVVRAGLDAVVYEAYPKVAYVELDFVAGYVFDEESLRNEMWGGLGLVVIEASRPAYFGNAVRQERYVPAFELLREARDRRLAPGEDAEPLRRELELTRGWLDDVQNSVSWRLTAPLRRLKRTAGRRAVSD
jgi:Methyltransferase domain